MRGKTVYLQYSNRQEIVNSKSTADAPGNVLLVTLEGVEAGDVSIDVLHLVRKLKCIPNYIENGSTVLNDSFSVTGRL